MRHLLLFFILLVGEQIVFSKYAFAEPSKVELYKSVFGDVPEQKRYSFDVPVVVDGRILENVGVEVGDAAEEGAVEVEVERFLRVVKPEMNAVAYAALAEKLRGQEKFSTHLFTSDDVAIAMDAGDLVLRVSVAPHAKSTRNISIRALPDYSKLDIEDVSDISAYVNFRPTYEYQFNGINEGRLPFRMRSDGALNIMGAVLEGDVTYFENTDRKWQRGNVRAVKDFPDKIVRVAAGDLSYPTVGFQAGPALGGLTVARNFSLQPYLVTNPTGSTSFVLDEEATVDVYVNQGKAASYRLQPGPYDVSDFPVTNGVNDVKVEIIEDSGKREVIDFALVNDNSLLSKGLHEFAYNVGTPSENSNGNYVYDDSTPSFTGFHRFGAKDDLTLGVNAQASEFQQMAGTEVTKAVDFGVFKHELGLSEGDNVSPDYATKLQYSYNDVSNRFDFDPSFDISAQYKGRDFVALGQDVATNNYSYQYEARYRQRAVFDINTGVGAEYRVGRDEQADDWSVNTFVNKSVGEGTSVNVNMEYEKDRRFGVLFSLSKTIPAEPYSAFLFRNTKENITNVNLRYTPEKNVGGVGANVSATRGNEVKNVTSELYTNQYFTELSGRHRYAENDSGSDEVSSEVELQMGSALVFADGHVGLSRTVGNSFAMVVPHKTIRDKKVGVNRHQVNGSEFYEAKTGLFGPAVVPDLSSYLYQNVKVDAASLPFGYAVDKDSYHVLPGYKSATVIDFGSGPTVLVDGVLKNANGEVMSLVVGDVVSLNDSGMQPQQFFTNREGRFRVANVKAGRYKIVLNDYPELSYSFDIEEEMIGQYDLGVVKLLSGVSQ